MVEWICNWSTIDYDGSKYYVTNRVYKKQGLAPDAADFSKNRGFD